MASALAVSKNDRNPSAHFFNWMRQLGMFSGQDADAFWLDQVRRAHEWFQSNSLLNE
jgi:hypothetical protein